MASVITSLFSKVANMQKEVPQPDAVMTLATLFAGEEVSALEAMVHDNHHIGP